MKFRKTQQGFTLIEVIISIVILAILLAGGMSLYHYSSDFMAVAMHKKIAHEIAANELETRKINGYGSLAIGTTVLTNVTLGTTYARTLTVAPYPSGAPDSKEVNISVNWTEGGTYSPHNLGIDLTTYIAP